MRSEKGDLLLPLVPPAAPFSLKRGRKGHKPTNQRLQTRFMALVPTTVLPSSATLLLLPPPGHVRSLQPLPPRAPLAQPPLPLPPPSLLLISHLKSESVAVLTAQKEAVMCINPCMGSGCDKSPRRDTLPRKLKASSDSLVTLVTQRQQQTTCATTTVQLGPSGVWTGARVSHKHVGG